MVESMSKQDFLETGALYADTLQEAMERYEYAIVMAKKKEDMHLFLEKIMQQNIEACYADFYFSMLKPEEQQRFKLTLSEAERTQLAVFNVSKQQVFYKINKELATFLLEVTARNTLFSSFYFTNKNVLLWGNYELKFPIFCEQKVLLKEYLMLADICGLEIER